MFYLLKVLIGREAKSLNRLFSYYTLDSSILLGMRVKVPFGRTSEVIGIILENPTKIDEDIEEYNKKQGFKLAQVIEKVDFTPLLNEEMITLAKKVAYYYKADLIKVINTMLPPSLKNKDSALKKAQMKTISYVFALKKNVLLSKNEKNLYFKIYNSKDGIRKSEITATASLRKLLDKKVVEIKEIEVSRIPKIISNNLIEYTLTKEQEECYQNILNSSKDVVLLEGVTGSGKTEVYIKLASYYLKQNKSVLVLVPEIVLTDRMADRFYSYFSSTVSILHSNLSNGRKYDEYNRILKGESKVVLATRSGIFAPLNDLGLIIIDEEHSSTYKQDNTPYYDAIKVATMRSEQTKCKVVLGSATPRIIDKARAVNNVYSQVFMKTKYSKNQDLDIILVNMNDSNNIDPYKSIYFSKRMIEELEKNLARKEQSLILLNRRGYSPIYMCKECKKIALCPNCNIPLNYHKRSDKLVCHHCGYSTFSIGYECTSCHSKDFLPLGFGTQRIYDDLKNIFPKADILRLDSDISNNEVRHQILDDVENGKSDILIGTQIIAKGHNFKDVTLACMIDSDASLNFPSYLADENTFDLISQFIGRAGRGEKKGRALLQTFAPDNKIIDLATKQDYEGFYDYEMKERKMMLYPPFCYLTTIIIKSKDQNRVKDLADKVKDYLVKESMDKRINIYGPSIPYIAKTKDTYFRHILLKYKNVQEVSKILDGLLDMRRFLQDTDNILIDVDSQDESI